MVVDTFARPATTRTVDDAERSFQLRIVGWARTSGLFDHLSECAGGENYIRTAYRLFSTDEARDVAAKYMLLVAVGDIFLDKRFPGEDLLAHKNRLEAAVTYLRRALVHGRTRVAEPRVMGAEILVAVAQQWDVMKNQYAPRAVEALVRQWLGALDAHYHDSVREWSSEVVDNPLVKEILRNRKDRVLSPEAAEALVSRYTSPAPAFVAERIRELVEVCCGANAQAEEAALELRVWLYLLDVNTIGAGLAFRSAALTMTPDRVPQAGIAALNQTLPLLDYRIRLANDASGFVEANGTDRDEGKINSSALLLPRDWKGLARHIAVTRAVHIHRQICKRIDAALDAELDRLQNEWPEMGQWVARGRKLGVHAYEVGHYTTFSHKEFTSVLEAQ